ncbi:MAG: flagellar hook-length control protein FliK [Lachnospiraceae bacterium]|nr:flagellar hook-length control protein FliK [Lachnospiraceae bacterium]
MAINLNALNAYRQAGGIGNNGNYNTEAISNSQTRVNTANIQTQQPANISPGQVLGGEVINVKNGEVTLRLDNNATLTAQLDNNIDISAGQKLVFQVTSNGEQMTLHPLYSNLNNNTMANAALQEAGMKATAQNLAMVSNMLDEGMSVNKQALQSMARSMEANPTTDPATVIQLTKLGLQVNELNIQQYENYMNFEHQIINDAEGLSTGLSDLLGTAGSTAAQTVITEDGSQVVQMTSTDTSAVLNEAGLQLSNDILNLISAGDKDWNALLNNPQITGVAAQSVEIAANGPMFISAEVPEVVPVEVEDVWAVTLNSDSEAAPEMNTSVNMGESTVNQEAGSTLSQGQMSDGSGQLMQNLMDDLSKLGMPQEELNNITNGTMSVNDLVDFVKTLINNNQSGVKLNNSQMETLTRLLNNNDFKQLVGNQLMKQMLLNPADVAKEGAIDELYKRLSEQSQRAMEILKDAGQIGSEVMKSAQNINDNVNFMNQLNQMAQYVQLPIRMNQENAHGELYVYTNKKKLQNNDGNVSAFLHLDMDNLGPMDVYVAMQKTKVNTNFYLADEAALNLFEANIGILDARLQEKGYNMTTSVIKKDPEEPQKNVIGEMLKDKSDGVVGGPIISKLSFDVRA